MARLMIDDPTRTNPLALITTARMAAIGDLVAPVAEYITATGDNIITVMENIVLSVGDAIFRTQSTMIGLGNLDTGSAFIHGRDYYVYICDNGTDNEVYRISLNTTFPQVDLTKTTAVKLADFILGVCVG